MSVDQNCHRKFLALMPNAASPQSLMVQAYQNLKIAITAGYWQPSETLPAAALLSACIQVPAAVRAREALIKNEFLS